MPVPRPKPHIIHEDGKWFVTWASKFLIAFGCNERRLPFGTWAECLAFVQLWYEFPRVGQERLYFWLQAKGVCYLCNRFIYLRDGPAADSRASIAARDAWLNLDHVIAKKEGGTNAFDNLRAVHTLCNEARHLQLPQSRFDEMTKYLKMCKGGEVGGG